MTNKNPTKTQWRPKTRQKHPKQELHQKKNNTKTKQFPRKPPETHLIFSKTHNPLPFIFTTNVNLTKPKGEHKKLQKHPKQEQDQTQNIKKTPKAIDSPQKSP